MLGRVSPGTASPSPYTKSAGEAPMSGFKVVRMDSITNGSFQNHCSGVSSPRAMRASLRRLWNLSTRPLALGWYGAVVMVWIPQIWANCLKMAEVNCAPLSEVTVVGTPKCCTHPYAKASTTDSVEMSTRGMAIGQRVKRSTAVKRYRNPFETGSVTKSMLMC